MYGAPGFVAAAQRTLLDHLVLVAREVFIPGSHRTMTIRETVLGRLTPKALYRHQTGHIHRVFLWRRPLCLSWSFSLQDSIHLVAYGAALKEHRLWTPSWCSPSAFFQLIGISQKTAYTFIWSSNFYNFHSGDTSRLSGFGGHWGLCLQPHRTVYICILLKAAIWGSDIQSAWI